MTKLDVNNGDMLMLEGEHAAFVAMLFGAFEPLNMRHDNPLLVALQAASAEVRASVFHDRPDAEAQALALWAKLGKPKFALLRFGEKGEKQRRAPRKIKSPEARAKHIEDTKTAAIARSAASAKRARSLAKPDEAVCIESLTAAEAALSIAQTASVVADTVDAS